MYICVSVHMFVHVCLCSVFAVFTCILLSEHDVLDQHFFVVPETTFLFSKLLPSEVTKIKKNSLESVMKYFVIIVSVSGQHSGTVGGIAPPQLNLLTSNLNVLLMTVWVSSMFSGFLPYPKNMPLAQLVIINCSQL